MSYILNALRKSERERMALQADTVTDRILVNQPQPRHKTGKLMLLLMLSNVIAVASLVWYVRKEPNTPLGWLHRAGIELGPPPAKGDDPVTPSTHGG